jgi:hypothetical protein
MQKCRLLTAQDYGHRQATRMDEQVDERRNIRGQPDAIPD